MVLSSAASTAPASPRAFSAAKRAEWLWKLRQPADLMDLRAACLTELRRGLEMHQRDPSRWRPTESDLMCLDCCLPELVLGSTPTKPGIYYGLDFGGSNIRFMRGKFTDTGDLHFSQRVCSLRDGSGSPAEHLPKGLLDPRATATMLFDFVAEQLLMFMGTNGDLEVIENCPDFTFPLGFTFSFGFIQEALDATPLYQWSKEFETGDLTQDPVVGSDICQLIRQAFDRKQVPARLIGVINDTAAVLLAANLQRAAIPSCDYPSCRIGLIFGTGVNGCYFEPQSRLYGYKGGVINTECGGLQRNMPFTEVDDEIDRVSANKGGQRLEKITSGQYIPEIIRHVILRTFDLDSLPPISRETNTLTCPGMAQIFSSERKNYSKVQEVFVQEWAWQVPVDDCEFLYDLVEAVWLRSCRMAGMLISALAEQTGEPSMVAVDGSLFNQCERFREEVISVVNQLNESAGIKPVTIRAVRDGSGIGAVALAALFNTY